METACGFQEKLGVITFGIAGQKNNAAGQIWMESQCLVVELLPRHLRHAIIGENKIETLGIEQAKSTERRSAELCAVPEQSQHVLEKFADHGFVIEDQNAG